MNYNNVIKKTLLYIEEHLKDEITCEALSKNAGYSEYHFCRLFKAETGLSVMDYVRKRRLVHAISKINNGGDLLTIAMEYGFETQGGFIKAFQKVYGTTPGSYRFQILKTLTNNIQLVSIDRRRKDKKMQINVLDNDIAFKKVMNIADKMFNVTAQGNGKYGYEFWEKQFRETPELMIYAEDSGKICGLAYGWVDNKVVTIAYLGVEKEYIGQGISKSLLTEIEKRAKDLGYNRLVLGVSEGEGGFYEKCGYAGSLLIQPEENSIEELRSIDPGYDEIWSGVYEGYVNQLYLKIPSINRALQRQYEETFTACNTIMVFGKTV